MTILIPSDCPEPSGTILLVEDDESLSQMLKFVLERNGYALTILADGQSARALMESGTAPPDLILLDIMLPFVDGFELIRIARAHADWALIPIIMLSGKTAEQDIVRALDAGASDYIGKPFQPDELLARVRRQLQVPA